MASSLVSGLRSFALNIADMSAAEDFFTRDWRLSVADRAGDAVYLRAAETGHHVLSLHKAPATTLRDITFRRHAEDLRGSRRPRRRLRTIVSLWHRWPSPGAASA